MHSYETIRLELVELVATAGGDRLASELLAPYCHGHPPDRSTIGRLRRGEGKTTYLAMATTLLKEALNNA